MGVVHAYKKERAEHNPVIYGAASDGLLFRPLLSYRLTTRTIGA